MEGDPRDGWEVALEATYRARIAHWFILQPDAQYVVNPSGDRDLRDALVIGIRTIISF